MTTGFPANLDVLINPTSSSTLLSPSHADQHANANDAIEALEAKVGVTNSATTTSLDYRVRNVVATTVAPLKRWHQQFGKTREGLVTGGAAKYVTDVLWVGDSIGEGYNSNVSNTTKVNVFTDNISKLANRSGRSGRWVPAGGDWLTSPKFSDQDSTLLGSHTITSGVFPSNEVFLNEDYATSIFPTAGNATIFALYVGTASISYTGKRNNSGKTVLTGVTIISSYFLSPPNTTFASGTSIYFGGDDTLTRGFSLRSRNLLPIAGQNIGDTATLEFTGDNVIVYYRKVKFLTGNIQFSLELKDSSGVYQPFYTSSSIYTYKSTGASYEQELVAWNAATAYGSSMARGDYRLKVYNYTTSPSGTNYSVSFDGAYVCDGNTDQGVRVWNSSKYGTNFSSFNSNVDTTLNADWLSALRNALVNPSLVVIALGTNELANPTTIESGLTTMVNSIKAAYAVGYPSNPYPSFAFFVPPADSNTISSEWAVVRNTFASVASSLGAALWNWAEFTGDVNSELGDPYGWTTDTIHPSNAAHRAIGDFVTSQALGAINSLNVFIPNYSGVAVGSGISTDPHLSIGNPDTGIYVTTASSVDTLNISADGTKVASLSKVGLTVTGSLSRGAPVTKTANFTLADSENWVICKGTTSITVTLPSASTYVGREITIKNIAAFTVVSASPNVIPIATDVAGYPILPATAGTSVTLVSNGTYWIVMRA